MTARCSAVVRRWPSQALRRTPISWAVLPHGLALRRPFMVEDHGTGTRPTTVCGRSSTHAAPTATHRLARNGRGLLPLTWGPTAVARRPFFPTGAFNGPITLLAPSSEWGRSKTFVKKASEIYAIWGMRLPSLGRTLILLANRGKGILDSRFPPPHYAPLRRTAG